MRRAKPGRLDWTIAGGQISITIHCCVARNQSAHRMRHDIELQMRTLQLRLQLSDAPHELACVADVVLSPVVWEGVERVLVAINSGIVPVAITITSIATQRYEQISVDVNLRQQTRELYSLDNLSRDEIVIIGREIRTDRQSLLRCAKRRRPNCFASLWVDQLRTENSWNDDHRALSGPGSSGCEDVFEVGSATCGNTRA